MIFEVNLDYFSQGNVATMNFTSVASSAVFPLNWACFDYALREKFSGRGVRFFGLFLAIPFCYFGLIFGVITSVKVSDKGVLYGDRRWSIFASKTA